MLTVPQLTELCARTYPLHSLCTFLWKRIGMIKLENSLTLRIFTAIAATAILMIGVMALTATLSIRKGFATHLLRTELSRMAPLRKTLAEVYAQNDGVWPSFGPPEIWTEFLMEELSGRGNKVPLPPFMSGQRPPPNEPPHGGPMPDQVGVDPRSTDAIAQNEFPPIDESTLSGPPHARLVLYDADGTLIAGARSDNELFERSPICLDNACDTQPVIGYLGLSAPINAITATDQFFLSRQYFSLGVTALVALILSGLVAFPVTRRILEPIKSLETGAKRLANGAYDSRIPPHGDDELGQLISHYNVLAETLERKTQAERTWISNTSHELQTPIAVLGAQIEAIQDGIRQPDEKTLSEMHATLARLSQLVSDLKILSFANEGELITHTQRLNLADLISEHLTTLQPLFERSGISVETSLPEAAYIEGDPHRMSQVIENILQNTLRYTDAPGRLKLSLHSEKDRLICLFEDSAPAPEAEQIPHLFDRFYRAESSRARALGGSGLGLSITQAIVVAHNGTIHAETSGLGGLRIVITLPELSS
ncbi:two-component system sensor histidine kinase BaeS [Celeribacter halophilus]|uniref:histidine kinase n=2 Tax=Celeribacter halophilus TaxID=576117 RepID=A0A1I3RTC0_9RHOB|nr:two-component system sensor histidine kinase BaeS [Celeribacter halophilus]SFJ48436.1 two-component system, OmpR family, sensor histidine kinase BaeS [Celeribacter halophilus]